jgi:hypothetical protein
VKIKDRIPPGMVMIVILWVSSLGFLAIIRYFDIGDYFFPKEFMSFLTILAVIFGPLTIINGFIGHLHPEWIDWSKDDNFAD